MKNDELLSQKLSNALLYLYNQEEKLKPYLDYLQQIMLKEIKQENLSAKDAFDMFIKIQEQYTNNILLITKIKEVIDFKL